MIEKKDLKKIDGLIEKVRKGDTESFGEIYDILLSDIYRFIFYKVSHKETAEDLTEDTFFKIWQNLDKYEKTEVPFTSWAYRIAYNTVIDHTRKDKQIVEIIEEIHDEDMSTSREAEQFYNQKILERALTHLPETQKEVVILKYVNDLSNKEISEVTGKSETAIRTLLSRAIAKLKEVLTRLEEDKK